MERLNKFPARFRAIEGDRQTDSVGGEDAFQWQAEISSDRLDSYYTHMAESTLRNFANDAQTGVPFLDSHNNRQLGYGHSYVGRFEPGDVSRVVAEFYTVPGIRFSGGQTYASTDDFIRAMKAALVRDVSVGFHGGDIICDICGNSFYDWRSCDHWPGVEYTVGDEGDEKVTSTFTIDDASLSEVSGVYDGATPGAMIDRARWQVEKGVMSPRAAIFLERRYRINLPGRMTWPGVNIPSTNPTERSEIMERDTENILSEVWDICRNAGAPEEHDTALSAVNWLAGEAERLRPLADEGRQYRSDLIEDALAEGVRAMGDQFPAETYRGMLKRAGLESIKALRDQWAAMAARQLPGGRQTTDTDETPPVRQPESDVPDAAYVA